MFEGKKRVGRHILEVKLKNRLFSFVDLKGKLADLVIQKTGFEKVSIRNGTRLDVATDDLTEVYFFSWESFGLQIDAAEDFTIFKNNWATLVELLKAFPDFKVNSIVRVGTRSMFMTSIKGKGVDELKQDFKNIMFKNHKIFEAKTNSKLSDIAYVYEALSNNNGKMNVTTGPVTKDEVLERYLNNVEKYKNFDKKSGIFIDIDLYQNEERNFASIDELTPIIEANIDEVEKHMDGFIEYVKNQGNE